MCDFGVYLFSPYEYDPNGTEKRPLIAFRPSLGTPRIYKAFSRKICYRICYYSCAGLHITTWNIENPRAKYNHQWSHHKLSATCQTVIRQKLQPSITTYIARDQYVLNNMQLSCLSIHSELVNFHSLISNLITGS